MQPKIVSLPSEYIGTRPPGAAVDTIVVHSMFAPGTNDPYCPHHCKALLDRHRVSAHYLLDRGGKIYRLADESDRARHAGVGAHPYTGVRRLNDTSIGVELIGSYDSGYTEGQYEFLARLIVDITGRHPVQYVLGHRHIAPDRKTDPWNFNWKHMQEIMAVCSEIQLHFPEEE